MARRSSCSPAAPGTAPRSVAAFLTAVLPSYGTADQAAYAPGPLRRRGGGLRVARRSDRPAGSAGAGPSGASVPLEPESDVLAAGRGSGGMSSAAGLRVDELTVEFGGLRALDRVSLEAPLGRVTGLIGPNGAGKTTTFSVCTGLLRPTSGSVTLFGADAGGMSPQRRARAGLGRTFQRVQLCESLSVRDNVMVGCEAGQAGSNPLRHLFASRKEEAAALEQVDLALTACGITGLAGQPVGSLSTGDRRLVELARALAGSYRLLLLDEPSSGLDVSATDQFGADPPRDRRRAGAWACSWSSTTCRW